MGGVSVCVCMSVFPLKTLGRMQKTMLVHSVMFEFGV